MESQRNSKFIEGKSPNCTVMVFHHAGGTSVQYSKLLHPLLEQANLLLVDLPGRFNNTEEINLNNFFPLLSEESGQYLSNNLILFGHSMGALTAFEFARFLIDKNFDTSKIKLILSGYRAPHLDFLIKNKKLQEIEQQEFNDFFAATSIMPQEISSNKDFMDFFMNILKRDLSFLENYHFEYNGPLDLEAHLLIPMKDSLAPKADQIRWSELFTQAPSIKFFEGDHFYLFEKPDDFVDKLTSITKNI